MLRRLSSILAAVAILATQPQLANAEKRPPKPGPDYVWKCVGSRHFCGWVLKSYVEKPGSVDPGKKPTKKPVHAEKPVCHLPGGALQACTSVLGNWSNSQQCYMRRETPPPPFSDPRWQGHTDGSIWACLREQGYDEGKHIITKWVWLPGKPDTVVVDPLTLVYEAIATMKLAPPLVRTAPAAGQIGLVNMPVWLWVDKSETTWGPIVRSASVPGLSITATAQVTAVNWSMGDGSTVRCEGPGTPYDKSMGVKASPTCGHRYTRTSHKLLNCKYPVTATAQWEITWRSTLGDTGQIAMTEQAATQLRIGEAVPVLVDPDGGDAVEPSKGRADGGCGD